MLYIKFQIKDTLKYNDFLKLYKHMLNVREPGFKFKEEPPLEFDWDNMTQEEVNEATEKILDSSDERVIETKRYQKFIPPYAHQFLESYLERDNDALGELGILDSRSLLNYLEYGFEVFFTKLETQPNSSGRITFETDNYPFGGLERFIMTLLAFDITPTECFDGFAVNAFESLPNSKYNWIELPEQTKAYLKKIKN